MASILARLLGGASIDDVEALQQQLAALEQRLQDRDAELQRQAAELQRQAAERETDLQKQAAEREADLRRQIEALRADKDVEVHASEISAESAFGGTLQQPEAIIMPAQCGKTREVFAMIEEFGRESVGIMLLQNYRTDANQFADRHKTHFGDQRTIVCMHSGTMKSTPAALFGEYAASDVGVDYTTLVNSKQLEKICGLIELLYRRTKVDIQIIIDEADDTFTKVFASLAKLSDDITGSKRLKCTIVTATPAAGSAPDTKTCMWSVIDSVSVRECVYGIKTYYGISKAIWQTVGDNSGDINQDLVHLIKHGFAHPQRPLPDHPYVFAPSNITKASHEEAAVILSTTRFDSPRGQYKMQVVVDNGNGYVHYVDGQVVDVIRKSTLSPVTVIKGIDSAEGIPTKFLEGIITRVKASGPGTALAYVSHLCVGRGKTLQDKDVPFTFGVISAVLLDAIKAKRGNGGKRMPYWDKVWREMYQILGRMLFAARDGDSADMPWVICNDTTYTIRTNMLAREEMAILLGGLGEEQPLPKLDEKQAEVALRRCMHKVLMEDNRSASEEDIDDQLQAKYIKQYGFIEFQLTDDDWEAALHEDQTIHAKGIVQWMRDIDVNADGYKKVKFIKSLARTMHKYIVDISIDDGNAIPYTSLPLHPKPVKIPASIKNVYDVRVISQRRAVRFYKREPRKTQETRKRSSSDTASKFTLPEEFLTTVSELTAEGNEDLLMAYTQRLTEYLQQQGHRSPTFWHFVDTEGTVSDQWSSGAGGSNAEQIFAYVFPEEPAVSYDAPAHSKAKKAKKAKRTTSATAQLLESFAARNVGFIGSLTEFMEKMREQFPKECEEIEAERAGRKNPKNFLHGGNMKYYRIEYVDGSSNPKRWRIIM